ncbi:hypothetical protein EST38_g9523 [Candolleomyces aberdarensis]|uniref:Uncharacterized protein n=1 Tax=Candolleomyces aberdarensis TaxID=2316362 RepID=A0A4Q2DAD8_9AGAR|nr:hypothetical protein EST38_g9523 [Candolleomyces aberdarensis]
MAEASERQSRHATPAPAPLPPSPPPPPLPLELPTLRTALYHILTFIVWLFEYTMSIVRPAVRYLRYPLIAIFFLFLLASLINGISSTLSAAFSPMCYVPIVNRMSICTWVTRMASQSQGGAGKVRWADFPGLVGVQTRTFEQLVDDSLASGSSGSGLALNIRKAEMATADLIALVRLSDLYSRNSLVETLSEFIQDAKTTEQNLHRLDAKVNGAVDSIMAMNDFAFHAIASARAKESMVNLRR